MEMTVPAQITKAPLIKELEEENELLLSQLHLVQEELEKYYLRNKALESGQAGKLQNIASSAKGWVDDELPNVLAENRRLQTLVEVQQKIHQLQTQNALNARLGNILIESIGSSGTLLSVPGKLRKIWKEETQQIPPDALGGKEFNKVISAYGEGGFDAVEQLIAGVSISPAMHASALTAVARHLMASDCTQAAEAARRACTLDPKPFRLKWLAFRLHEAGEVIEAEAMLDLLPADTPFSDSETRQASQLRSEAKHIRQRTAKQQTTFFERRAEIEKQLNSLAHERDHQTKLAAERGDEIEQCTQKLKSLQQTNSRLEEEKSDQTKRYEEAQSRVIERNREIAALHQARAQLETENAALVQQYEAAERLAGEREEDSKALKEIRDRLIQKCTRLEQEKAALVGDYEKQTSLTEERQAQIIELTQAIVVKEAEQAREVEALHQARAQLEAENLTLAQQCEAVKTLIGEHEREIEAFKQVQTQQKQTLTQLEQEKTAQTKRREEAEKLAAERLKQIGELQQQIQSHQADEAKSATRQQFMQEEMARAEAQLDLIKEMMLMEPAL